MAHQSIDVNSLPKDFHKMPANYDFSHKGTNLPRGVGIDWKSYEKDFTLRTDAVWEKQQLRDWFRLYTKCFYFDTTAKRYSLIEPEDIYTIIYEGCMQDF